MLKERDLRLFSEACVELYQPGLGMGNYAERAFAFVEKMVPAEFIAFGSLDLTTEQLDIGFNHSVSEFPKAMEAFGSLMGKYDLFKWDPTVNDGKPFCRSDYFSRRQFRELDIYSEVYKRIGIDDHCAVFVPGASDEVAFFGIEREKGHNFTADERVLLELAQTHLGNAREVAKVREQMMELGASPEPLAEAGLTPREAEVLTWLAEGKSNEEISILLRLKLYTVKGYVKTIFQKIGAPNRLAASLWALRVCRRYESRQSQEGAARFVSVPAKTRE